MSRATDVLTSFASAFLLAATLLWLPSSPLRAQEVSDERWINGPDSVLVGSQRNYPDVAVREDGTRIHVYEASGPALESRDIFVRRFDATGAPLEEPQQVNTTTADIQGFPRVAASADGSYLVVFQSLELDPGLGDIAGNKVDVVRAPKRPGDIYLSYFDCTKAKEQLGWQSQVSLKEGLGFTVAYFRELLSG